MRILFTTVPLSGHFYPLVPLAWAFRARGHEVLVATSEEFVPTVLRAGLPAVSCGSAMVSLVDLTAGDSGNGEELRRYAHGRVFAEIAARNLPGMTSLMNAWRPDLVVSERAELSGPIAAAVSGVPWVEFHWGIAELGEYRMGGADILAGELEARGLDGLPRPGLVVNPWPRSLRLPYAADHRSIRHVSYNGDASVPSWAVERQAGGRICLTLGTVVPHLEKGRFAQLALPILEQLAQLNVEIVVAVDAGVAASWPPLPPVIRHVGRMPLSQVLAACDLVVHHGGQGTALTALEAGIPQLVLPQFDDQFENAGAVAESGAGIRLLPAQITPQAVAKGCLELLGSVKFGIAASDIAAEMAAAPSPLEITGIFEKLIP
ncbi:glycosyl transferase, UDP-glucuronosyltransferase [Amycolatopsis japonica]|uniref:Glycosyl transferase, UDP-glucuronosyltransferase n=1 Tax=Amycolatopsis japonica TaxID=208439 RepID=A0A075UUL6_9PSEU|nr:nucleotide disphospho-sugar-binding domain-containing protein [Amycolatopsis japonica]AIG76106.1 glycosyl transferase, UDP-glucuronosyltransferase [Amycolatopsis japonica]